METCENCGCRVYKLGCVNCDEQNYIDEQEHNNSLPEQYVKTEQFETFITPTETNDEQKD